MARGTAVEQLAGLAPRPASVQKPMCRSDRQQLRDDYARYAQIILGQAPMTGPEWQEVAAKASGLTRYQTSFMPHEILHWGGDLAEMFPQTCRTFAERGICLTEFVAFWFRSPRPLTHSYDFFLLKIERFLEFVTERTPDVRGCVQQECDMLRLAYAQANEVGGPVMEMARTR
jgi:hypothetical protein